VVGEAEVLPTPAGKVLEALARAGCRLGVSSRGFGSTKQTEDGVDEVQDDFQLVTYDVVADPAASSAYPAVYYEWRQQQPSRESMMEDDKRIAEAVQKREAELKLEASKREADLKAEFTSQLDKALVKLRAEARETVRTELLSDPKVAGARGALEAIKAVAAPYLLGEDATQLLSSKDTEISELRSQLKAKEEELTRTQEELNSLAEMAKAAGYKYYLERQLAGDPDADLLRKAVGDVLQYESADAMKSKIDSVRRVAERRRQEESAAKAKAEEAEKQHAAALAALQAENATLKEGIGQAVRLAKRQALASYAERQNPGSQRERARSTVENANVNSKEEVDRLLEGLPKDRADYKNENVRARIKRNLGAGHEASALAEETPDPSTRRENHDYNGLGAELNEIRELAGINH
jgi:hypothetical protein